MGKTHPKTFNLFFFELITASFLLRWIFNCLLMKIVAALKTTLWWLWHPIAQNVRKQPGLRGTDRGRRRRIGEVEVIVHGSREHVKELSGVRLLNVVEEQSKIRVRDSDASTERGSAGGTSGPHQKSSHYCTGLNSNGILRLTRPCISTEDAITTDWLIDWLTDWSKNSLTSVGGKENRTKIW